MTEARTVTDYLTADDYESLGKAVAVFPVKSSRFLRPREPGRALVAIRMNLKTLFMLLVFVASAHAQSGVPARDLALCTSLSDIAVGIYKMKLSGKSQTTQ